MKVEHRSIEGGIWIVGWTSTIGASEAVTISGGVAAATGNKPNLILDGEAGAADVLDKITGFVENQIIYVRSTHNDRDITITNGTFFRMPVPWVIRNTYQIWVGLCVGSDTFIELHRSPNV